MSLSSLYISLGHACGLGSQRLREMPSPAQLCRSLTLVYLADCTLFCAGLPVLQGTTHPVLTPLTAPAGMGWLGFPVLLSWSQGSPGRVVDQGGQSGKAQQGLTSLSLINPGEVPPRSCPECSCAGKCTGTGRQRQTATQTITLQRQHEGGYVPSPEGQF